MDLIFYIVEHAWLQFVPVVFFGLYSLVVVNYFPNNKLVFTPVILFLLKIVILITGLVTIVAVISVWYLAFAWIPATNLAIAVIVYKILSKHHITVLGVQDIRPQSRFLFLWPVVLIIAALLCVFLLYLS